MYTSYLIYADYTAMGGNILPAETAEKILRKASRHIDSLTFNRIRAIGFDKLTTNQQEIIKEVCFNLAEFEYENEELLNTVLSSYSINGVSMAFGAQNWNIITQSGVAIKRDDYDLLSQTGLCCLSFRK
jgi:hypothetical protein